MSSGSLLALLAGLLACRSCWAQTTVTVTTGTQLLLALNDSSVGTIFLNASIGHGLDGGANAPLLISRNVTITKAPSLADRPVLSCGKQFARLRLARGVWFTIQEVQVLGVLGVGTLGPGWTTAELFGASPDAVLRLNNLTWRQLVCPPLDIMQQDLLAVPPPTPSAAGGSKQDVVLLPAAFTLNDSVSPTALPGGLLIKQLSQKQVIVGDQGGYTQVLSNVTLVCLHALPPECAQQASQLPACMSSQAALLDPLTGLQLDSHQAPDASITGGSSSSKVLGGVLGTTGAILVMAVTACLAWRHHHQQQVARGRGRRGRGLGLKRDSLIPSNGTTSSAQDEKTGVTRCATVSGAPVFNPNMINPRGNDLSDLQLGLLIGSGSFGRVYRGSWRGKDVAVKKILHSRAETVKIQRELALSMALKHPNLVQSIDFAVHEPQEGDAAGAGAQQAGGVTTSDPLCVAGGGGGLPSLSSSGYLFPSLYSTAGGGQARGCDQGGPTLETWIVQELCDQGPLSSALHAGRFGTAASRSHSQMCELLLRAHDVACGLQFLHARGVCHGDLKPDNTLLQTDARDPFNTCALICDFGLSRALGDGRTHVTSRNCGTVTHMSPEVLMHGRLKPSADVYSFGVLLWELVTGSRPYAGLTEGEVVHSKVVDKTCLHLPQSTPHGVVCLIQSCWSFSPDARPACDQVVQSLADLIKGMNPDLAALLSPSWQRKAGLAAAAASAPSLSAAAITEEASGSSSAAVPSSAAPASGDCAGSKRQVKPSHVAVQQYTVYCYDVNECVAPQMLE